jgi:O-antigen/teichoic acid export membrane protein
MILFAQVASPEELAIRNSIESLRTIFVIILALAIGEAFKQFVSDSAEKPEDRHIHWWRLPALLAFIVLVVPFSHGMARYFFDNYSAAARPKPYAPFLLFDTIVIILLSIDIGWGAFTAWHHAPLMWRWVLVNGTIVPLLLLVLLYRRKHESLTGVVLCAILIVARSVADYWVSFEFYFPPQP